MDNTIRDRLSHAKGILIAILVVSTLCISIIGFMMVLSVNRSPLLHEQFMRISSRSNLTLVPSGRFLRQPDSQHPGVDLRYTPWLPFLPPAVASLLLTPQTPISAGRQ